MSETKIGNPDKVARAEDRLNINSWDIEAWNVLLRDAQSKPIEESRHVFEKIVKQFPLSGQYVKSFIAQEKKANNFDNVENLFKEFLPKIYHIDLWKYYLSYIKEKDNKSSQFKERMAKAYDYAIEKMGLDIKSFSIWSDYIYFLKSTQVNSQYAESQKALATRRTYQKAFVTPMIGIETIWRDYNTFENSLNNIIAKRFIDEFSKDYMNARRVTKEYEAITKGLNRNIPSVPPQNTTEETRQKDLWKKYINWEKNNPLNTDDLLTVTKRTLFAFEQCLLCLGHHPDIWYEAAVYLEQASKLLAEKGDQENSKKFADRVSDMYQRATSILKDNLLLGFAYADYEESRSRFDKVDSIYKNMISNTNIDPTLVYIQYSRFIRRSKGIIGARDVFKIAREDSRASYQIYINAAMMEHYCTKEPSIAQRIFEYGLKKYMRVPEYIIAYLDYMDHINEDNNTRVLFERSLGSGCIPANKSSVIWDRYLQFESFVGDLASILKVERRRLATAMDAINSVNSGSNVNKEATNSAFYRHQTALIIDRYRFGDLYPCSDNELKSIGYIPRIALTTAHNISSAVSVTPSVVGGLDNPASLLHHHLHIDSADIGAPVSGLSNNSAVNSGANPPIPCMTSSVALANHPRPDLAHMLPFKPRAFPRLGAHPVPGGEFPPPPSASVVMSMVPPPICFHGPFVNVASLLELLLEVQIPEEFANPPPNESMILDNGMALIIENTNNTINPLNRKRTRVMSNSTLNGVLDDDEGQMMVNNMANGMENGKNNTSIGGNVVPYIQDFGDANYDIFKSRLQKRQRLMAPMNGAAENITE